MSTESIAVEFVKKFYRKKKPNKKLLVKKPAKQTGFDLMDEKGKLYIEVKGTAKKELKRVLFRNFTDGEREKAANCQKNNKKYEIHLIVGAGTLKHPVHYKMPGRFLLKNSIRRISWDLPIRPREMKRYLVK